jgi:hypothetical protein
MMEGNRMLEYLGLAKMKMQNEDSLKLFTKIGRLPFPADQAEAHLAKLKARDVTIDKNKKLK